MERKSNPERELVFFGEAIQIIPSLRRRETLVSIFARIVPFRHCLHRVKGVGTS
jgi:hypothetical protein